MNGVLLSLLLAGLSAAAEGGASEVPEAFAPFEHLIGGWKGTGVPSTNPLKGWPEKQNWAWRFDEGHPVGLSLSAEGGKTISEARLDYDPETKIYRLDGTDPEGEPVAYAGTIDDRGQVLTLNREGEGPGGGKERLVLRINSNMIRYTLDLERQPPGVPRFRDAIRVGLTKEGESFAVGSEHARLPKCVLTGGAATLSVSYAGKSYPVCCTGCRDEFLADPGKYARKAEQRARSVEAKPADTPAPSGGPADDGAFDGLVTPKDRPDSHPKDSPRAAPGEAPKQGETAPAEVDEAKKKADDEARAQTFLRLGQALEKAGKVQPALEYYHRVIDQYPETPQAKTARERASALQQ